MDEEFKTTTSHTVIRAWVENQGGKPALIVDPNRLDKRVGLRIDFPGKGDEALLSHAHHNQDVSWDEFFRIFDGQELAFEYLEKPEGTDLVDAFRFLKREALNDPVVSTPFNTEAFAAAVRGDESAFLTHNVTIDRSPSGEDDLGGSTTDQEADDDTTQAAADLGELEKGDSQAKHDLG